MRIVNPISIRPDEVRAGDVMICTVTLHVFAGRGDGLLYRMYRCPHNGPELDRIPQGSRMGDEKAVQEQLFPVVGWAGARPDLR